MNAARTAILTALAVATGGAAMAQDAGEAPKPGLLKRGATVDKPIPETYEPLTSTHIERGEELNESIEQSWEMKKKAKEQQEQATRPPAPTPERQKLEERIEEPGADVPAAPLPQLESQEKSIRISEP